MEKVVIFDMDGVLVDTEPVYYRRLEEFLISRGYHFSRAVLDSLVGESSRTTFSIQNRLIQHFMIVRKPIAAICAPFIATTGSFTASWRILIYIKR